MASSSRTQVTTPTASAGACLTWEALSVDVRWRPRLSVVIVTHLVTRSSADRAMVQVERPPGCKLVAGWSVEVIQAGQSVDPGLSRTPEGHTVAAVCCCRREASLTIKCQRPCQAIPSMRTSGRKVYLGQ